MVGYGPQPLHPHCQLVGRPGRTAALERFLDHVTSLRWVASSTPTRSKA
jgi:hypothetical protein